MSTNQNQHSGKENPPESEWDTQLSMGDHISRSHWTTSRIIWKECHYDNSGLILQNDETLPHDYRNYLTRSYQNIPWWNLQTTQDPPQSHIWSGTSIRLIIYERALLPVADRGKPIHCLSSRNQWTNGTSKCMGRTISMTIRQPLSNWLVRMAFHSRICSQPNDKLSYELLSVYFKLWTTTTLWLCTETEAPKPRSFGIHWRNKIHPTSSQVHTQNGCLWHEMFPRLKSPPSSRIPTWRSHPPWSD